MPAVTVTRPTREKLADLVSQAADHKEPDDIPGCCWRDALCDEHEAAWAMTQALRLLAFIVEQAGSDEEALNAIRAVRQSVRDEVAGATTDIALRAAITGGNGGTE